MWISDITWGNADAIGCAGTEDSACRVPTGTLHANQCFTHLHAARCLAIRAIPHARCPIDSGSRQPFEAKMRGP
jgi:hypothetical protein